MTPYYADDWLTVYLGDCRDVMAQMAPESVHCVVTSPPYWGLRDYGSPGQLGLEPTPEAYVENMVAVFREVRRVLRSDGTVWLNLGDSYAGSWGNQGRKPERGEQRPINGPMLQSFDGYPDKGSNTGALPPGLKPKDLVGIPWRVAFALQADGWYLRSDVIWSKPNPMPESVTDRPTKAHEYLFLLSKKATYYYDADAVREAPLSVADSRRGSGSPSASSRISGGLSVGMATHMGVPDSGRNLRSVWSIATAPYPGAHFATFPAKLVEPCIKAGTSERGVCPECGAPWIRELLVSPLRDRDDSTRDPDKRDARRGMAAVPEKGWETTRATTGWRPSCSCVKVTEETAVSLERWEFYPPVPATVLDPFAGSGTTGMVAQSLSRKAVLIDLSADYLRQLMGRNRDIPLGLETA